MRPRQYFLFLLGYSFLLFQPFLETRAAGSCSSQLERKRVLESFRQRHLGKETKTIKTRSKPEEWNWELIWVLKKNFDSFIFSKIKTDSREKQHIATQVEDFTSNIFKHASLFPQTLLYAYSYLSRYLKSSEEILTPKNYKKFVAVAFLLADKYNDDSATFINAYYLQILNSLAPLEQQTLSQLDALELRIWFHLGAEMFLRKEETLLLFSDNKERSLIKRTFFFGEDESVVNSEFGLIHFQGEPQCF